MAVRTTVTSTIRVPVYAVWRCSKCGEINFSEGVIACSASSTSTAFFHKTRVARATEASEQEVNASWKQTTLGIIADPIENYQKMRQCFHLYHYKCSKCGNKEKWNKGMAYLSVACFDLMPTIISLLFVIAMPSSIGAWLFFLLFAGILACCIFSEKHFKTVLKNLPSMPVIGSLNPELKEYAEQNQYHLLDLKEVLLAAAAPACEKEDSSSAVQTERVRPADIGEDADILMPGEMRFCRKCGSKLMKDSKFCHKCGTEVLYPGSDL